MALKQQIKLPVTAYAQSQFGQFPIDTVTDLDLGDCYTKIQSITVTVR